MLGIYAFTASCIIIEQKIYIFLSYGTFLKAFRILVDTLKLLNRLFSNICEAAKNTLYILSTKFSHVQNIYFRSKENIPLKDLQFMFLNLVFKIHLLILEAKSNAKQPISFRKSVKCRIFLEYGRLHLRCSWYWCIFIFYFIFVTRKDSIFVALFRSHLLIYI